MKNRPYIFIRTQIVDFVKEHVSDMLTNSAKKDRLKGHSEMSAGVLNVPSVLQDWSRGETKPYDTLLELLSDPKLQSAALIEILRSIRGCVAQLDHTHEVLVGLLMKINWPCREDTVIKEYRSFLLNLLSAHTFYLRAGLRMLVQHFLPVSSVAEYSEDAKKNDENKFMNIHLVLRAVSSIIPMTLKVLLPLLSSCFPYILVSLNQLECYTTNLLGIPQYMPQLRQPILELILTRLVQLDVRCPRRDIEAAEREYRKDAIEDDLIDDITSQPMQLEDAHKLDILMDVLYNYIHNTVYDKDVLDWEVCKKLYRELLLVFERIVLPTYATCHTQFFMFYVCSFNQVLADGFIDYLWKKFQSPNTETVFRQTSIGYIGSFLSRAKYIPVSTVKTCLDLMAAWVHRYLEELSSESMFADVAHHAPFYSVCQAIFYVFCFRSKDFLDGRKGYKWAEGLHLQRIVTSRLNPLRLCLPIVVETFSSIARIHQLAFCDTIIEKNKRFTVPVSAQDQDGFVVQTALLDSFFPFDPYLLHTSGMVIQPIYREYDSGISTDSETDQDMQNEDDDFLTESRSESLPISIPTRQNPRTAQTDFLQYGTSPGFKHL